MGNRLADLDVVKGRQRVVGGQDRFTLGAADQHLKPRVSLELGQVFGGGETGKSIHILGHHSGKGGGRVRDELERRLGQRGRVPPIGVVAFQFDLVALHPVHEFERAGADGRLFDVLDAFGCHDHSVAPCQVEQQAAVRFRQGQLDRQRVDHLDIRDAGVQRLLRVHAVFGAGTVQAEFDVFGVHRGAVMERHAVVQLERICQAVVGNFPAFGQTGHDRPVAHKARQTLEHVGIQHRIDGAGGGAGGIKVRWLKLHGDGDVVLGQGRSGDQRSGRDPQQKRTDVKHFQTPGWFF